MEALTLTNSSTDKNRRELDYYPTPPDVTHALMRFLHLHPCRVWEPACGDGAMAEVLKQYGHEIPPTCARRITCSPGAGPLLACPS